MKRELSPEIWRHENEERTESQDMKDMKMKRENWVKRYEGIKVKREKIESRDMKTWKWRERRRIFEDLYVGRERENKDERETGRRDV